MVVGNRRRTVVARLPGRALWGEAVRGAGSRRAYPAPLLFAAFLAACAGAPPRMEPRPGVDSLVPESIPADRSGLEPLSAALRAKTGALGLNGMRGLGGEQVSRALVLLPEDRTKSGIVSFELEDGPEAGVYQCEALGRGLTSTEPKPGWRRGDIGGRTVYYAPMEAEGGATVPGVYDVRNIVPEEYEMELLNRAADLKGEEDVLARIQGSGRRPRFSGVWKHWYSRLNSAVPIDMTWSERYQRHSQGAGRPVFERRPEPKDEAARLRQAKQLSRDKRYFRGPYGRYGFANHTDRWDDPGRMEDPSFAGRPELSDFRFRDTNGCLKVRADCLELLNKFVAEQSRKGRRVQYDVREIPWSAPDMSAADAVGRP